MYRVSMDRMNGEDHAPARRVVGACPVTTDSRNIEREQYLTPYAAVQRQQTGKMMRYVYQVCIDSFFWFRLCQGLLVRKKKEKAK